MTPTDWLAAWLESLEALQGPAYVGFVLLVGISGIRFVIRQFKGAYRDA